jgi:CRP/FNR family transcriptional regulator
MPRKTNYTCDLQSCFLCSRSLAGWRLAIAERKENRKFKKGASIFAEGNQVDGIFFIYSGKVKVHMKWGLEKELILRFARAGDIIGYRGLAGEFIHPVTATALEDVVVCFIDIPFFESTLQVNPNLTYEFMKMYANELSETERRMRNLAHMEVKGRIADTLLMLKKKFGINKEGYIDISLTRQDIASYSGTTYETFSRVANDLVKEKTVRFEGKNITIIKEKRLTELTMAST